MRIASFNIENLFDRVVAMNMDTWADGKPMLDAYSALNGVLGKTKYTAADKAKIIDLLGRLDLKKSDKSKFAILRQNKGKLIKRPKTGPIKVVANGRADWIGWLDLNREAVNEIAIQNTARVIKEIDPDILAVIEAENRTALCRFNDQILGGQVVSGKPFEHVMLIDGNDERGIDVGIYSKARFPIVSILSHVDEVNSAGSRIFSRDCAQYEFTTPKGSDLLVLVNHLKSKGFGSQASSNARRKAQAKRVREIYDGLRGDGVKNIAIVGDFNDTPDSGPLSPLLSGSNLKDVSAHPNYIDDGRPGTYANGTASNKIDYILLSPELHARVKRAGVFRKGVWGGTNGTLFPHLPTITKASEAASDHAAIWADLDI